MYSRRRPCGCAKKVCVYIKDKWTAAYRCYKCPYQYQDGSASPDGGFYFSAVNKGHVAVEYVNQVFCALQFRSG